MKTQRNQENQEWNPQNFLNEEFDPIIPSHDDDDYYEALGVDDDQLAETIRDVLDHCQMLDPTDIHVSVTHHDVVLRGSVSDFEAKKHTEEIVRSIEGVGNISNHLSVEYGPLNS